MTAVLDEFCAYLIEQGAQTGTIEAYRQDTQLFLQTPRTLSALSAEEIEQWLADLQTQGVTENSIARKMAAIRRFCHFLEEKGVLGINPGLRLTPRRRTRSVPNPISFEQLSQLFSLPTPAALDRREAAIVAVLVGTGLRISRLRALRVQDVEVHPDLAWVRVHSHRIALFGAPAEALRLYLPDLLPGALFRHGDQPMTREGLWKAVRRRCKAAGIDGSAMPTRLRAAFITELMGSGHPTPLIQKAAGLLCHETLSRYREAARLRRAPAGL